MEGVHRGGRVMSYSIISGSRSKSMQARIIIALAQMLAAPVMGKGAALRGGPGGVRNPLTSWKSSYGAHPRVGQWPAKPAGLLGSFGHVMRVKPKSQSFI